MRVIVQLDHPSKLNPASDSSLMLMEEAQKRGYEVFFYEPETLTWHENDLCAPLSKITLDRGTTPFWHAEEPRYTSLHSADVILMRQDPPFDMAYITATHLLERLMPRVPVWNNPAGVRNAPEKLSVLGFWKHMPATLISRDPRAISDFAKAHEAIVAKPLYGFGGHSVYKFNRGDSNLDTLLEHWLQTSREPLMWQEFRPEVKTADRRVLLIDGQVATTFARLPDENSIRANMRVGGVATASPDLSPTQQRICDEIGPFLVENGLLLTGLDFIGDYLTEINVTCPTGLRAAERLYGLNLAGQFWDKIIEKNFK